MNMPRQPFRVLTLGMAAFLVAFTLAACDANPSATVDDEVTSAELNQLTSTLASELQLSTEQTNRINSLATGDERLPGRGYGRPDREDLLNVSILGMVGALLMFLSYSLSEQGLTLYPDRWLLWVALVPIAWWLFRMVRLGWYGKQDYDPIVFALRDKRGVGLLLITLSLMFWAAGLWQDWFGL